MSKDYEEFMSSQKTKEKVTDIKTTEINKNSNDKKLDLILEKLENIETKSKEEIEDYKDTLKKRNHQK